MSYITTEMLKKGYLLYPKALFEEQMSMKTNKKAESFFEAFLLVLTHANYSTVTCRVNGRCFDCVRGESVLSLAHWARIFGWSDNRTRYFFQRMYDLGIIERLVNPYITHIRIPDYDLLTGHRTPACKAGKGVAGEGFDAFWKQYHEITGKSKINIGRARREWNKLSANERHLALANIEEYYYHLTNIKYCKQAATYLADKSFKNEYND